MKNMNHPQNEMNNGFWSSGATRTVISLAAGAVAGAVTALLLAPQSGSETRRALANSAGRVKDTLSDTIQSGINKLSGQGLTDEDLLSNSAAGRKQSTGRTTTGNAGYNTTNTPGSAGTRGI